MARLAVGKRVELARRPDANRRHDASASAKLIEFRANARRPTGRPDQSSRLAGTGRSLGARTAGRRAPARPAPGGRNGAHKSLASRPAGRQMIPRRPAPISCRAALLLVPPIGRAGQIGPSLGDYLRPRTDDDDDKAPLSLICERRGRQDE